MKRIFVIILLLCIPVASFASDPFKNIVKAIENEYGVHHHGIPWFARAIIKPAMWGSGVSGLKVADFENVSLKSEEAQRRVAEVIEQTVGPEWQQIVRVRSLHSHETTYIYVRPMGPKFTMLVVNVEPNEAAVVQMNLNPNQLQRWVNDTDEMAKSQHHHRPQDVVAAGWAPEVLISSNTPGGYGIVVP